MVRQLVANRDKIVAVEGSNLAALDRLSQWTKLGTFSVKACYDFFRAKGPKLGVDTTKASIPDNASAIFAPAVGLMLWFLLLLFDAAVVRSLVLVLAWKWQSFVAAVVRCLVLGFWFGGGTGAFVVAAAASFLELPGSGHKVSLLLLGCGRFCYCDRVDECGPILRADSDLCCLCEAGVGIWYLVLNWRFAVIGLS
ncbi:hypothetical protein Acr_00g0037050 [Actinidia rufa]|uniref:Uncharacterized protein n=1 Tax=Actinidia rufa TaxID=165716 RepID=A0A7J0DIN1_9ERIC|nr:hypothetical protein Acr_00g0037050 [Actinidia rufa]